VRNESENGPSGAFERGYKIWSPKNTREIWSPSTSNRLHRDLPPTAPPPLSSISAAGLDSANSGHFLPRRPSPPISIPPRGTASPPETIVWDPACTEMGRRSWRRRLPGPRQRVVVTRRIHPAGQLRPAYKPRPSPTPAVPGGICHGGRQEGLRLRRPPLHYPRHPRRYHFTPAAGRPW
jgi:hypothetical protein